MSDHTDPRDGTPAAPTESTAVSPTGAAVDSPDIRPSVLAGDDGIVRCAWVGSDAEYQRYHDEEWGTPLRDDRALFEKICLEGFQAGLSWRTILLRREGFRAAFHGFDIELVAAMDDDDVERLLQNAAIIRHRGKINATIQNARATLQLKQPLTALIWSYVPSARGPRPASLSEIPAVTPESTALSRTLRSAGFRFVGPTTMYALMQSAGLVDDHVAGCWRASVR